MGRLFGGAMGALALTFAARPAPAPAQDAAAGAAAPPPVEGLAPLPAGYLVRTDGRARLGVYLHPGCYAEPAVRAGCDAPPVVAGVVEGAPAAEAGVQTGDTLLALDGVSLRSEAGRQALANLRDGEPVSLRIGRGSGRRDLRLTPTARPMEGLFELSGPTWRSAAPSNVQVFRLRDEQGGVAEFHFTPSRERPGRSTGSDGFVVFEADESGVLSLGFGRPNVEVFTRDGRRVELTELERRIREAGEEAAQEFGVARVFRSTGGHGVEVQVEVGGRRSVEGVDLPRRLILEDAPLARRLESVHRETLAEARTRIDSILSVRAELARRGELPPAAGYGFAFRSRGRDRESPGTQAPSERRVTPASEAPAPSTYRLAGAEFRSLTAELAEYFAVDTGVLVLRVIPETPADRLGLRGGDVIVEVGGRATPDVTTFRAQIGESLARGLEPEVKWNRKGNDFRGNLTPR
jgi:membrane-associated protease RseP (regulator of RpoE activity)